MKRQRDADMAPRQVSMLKYALIVGFMMIVIAVVVAVSVLAFRKADTVLKDKVCTLTSSLNVQMQLNLKGYLDRMETIGTLAFGEEVIYTYDATDPKNDEYEAINTEKKISDKLYSLCIMENFVDYGIVYRNDHTVGKISNGTNALFGDKKFESFEAMITDQRTHDGWEAGLANNYNRIYYVKRVHENAVLVISFYAAELEDVFDNSAAMADMSIRLTDQDYSILYSSDRDEVGTPLPDPIRTRVQGQRSATVLDNDYLVTVNATAEDWYVICSIPTEVILREEKEVRLYIILVSIVAVLLAATIGAIFASRMTRPMEGLVTRLDNKARIDQLTGILNKRTFEEEAAQCLRDALPTEQHAIVFLDIDNFKGVNDTLGHAYGDKVLAKVGSILRGTFSGEDYLGRVGGDEFAVLVNTVPEEGDYRSYITALCEALCKAFRSNYTGDDGRYKISASIGVAIFSPTLRDYAALCKAADEALYRSKGLGKDTYTIRDDA